MGSPSGLLPEALVPASPAGSSLTPPPECGQDQAMIARSTLAFLSTFFLLLSLEVPTAHAGGACAG